MDKKYLTSVSTYHMYMYQYAINEWFGNIININELYSYMCKTLLPSNLHTIL